MTIKLAKDIISLKKSKQIVKSKNEIIELKVFTNRIPKKVIPAIIKCSLKFNLRFLNKTYPLIANKGTNEKIIILA